MSQQINVTYYHHSGFSAAMDDVLLVFDYWQGEHGELPASRRITPEFLSRFKEIYVFISHEHGDHLDPVVFEWRESAPVTYIVSYDMPIGTRGKRMSPMDSLKLSEKVSVQCFDSTDLGVSFLVNLCGIKIFHAGDLNFWHWREESTAAEIEDADRLFRKAVEPLTKEQVDVAFFPVDPRLGLLFDAGANYFQLAVKPRLMIPMHFWGRGDIIIEFARRSRSRQTEIVPLTLPGEQMLLDFEENGYLTVNVDMPEDSLHGQPVDLGGYEGRDPFNETDLPVDIGQ